MDVTAPIFAGALGPPGVVVLGESGHADFCEAIAALCATARVTTATAVDEALTQLAGGAVGPELIVLAQSRPGVVRAAEVQRLRRAAPLADVVTLAGSWCEGELRTGRPLAGVRRLYWYEFVPWWRRQLARRAAGLVPDWAWPDASDAAGAAIGGTGAAATSRGVVVLETIRWDTADALADVVGRAGLTAVWQPPGCRAPCVWGAVAGVWEGAQLSRREERDLGAFCRRLGASVPVVALLDFPRRRAVERARQLGATAVLGKPWRNVDLLQSLARVERRAAAADASSVAARAA